MKENKTEAEILMEPGAIPVAVAADDNYAETLAVCLYSILEHTKARIDFIILDGGIQPGNKEKIAASLRGFSNYTIRYADMAAYNLDRFPALQHFGVTTFARYFIPDICTGYSKVVYTDSDVAFTRDIAEYYATDMEGYGLAATPDEVGAVKTGEANPDRRRRLFGIPADHAYFSAGNLLVDCDYWRRNDITAKLVQKTVELYDKLVYPDLDVLNTVFANSYKRMPYTYCCCVHREEATCGHAEMEEAFRGPVIIHYSGQVKPWNSPDVVFADYYRAILRKTAFRRPLEDGGKLHTRYLLAKLLRGLCTMQLRVEVMEGDVAEYLELVDAGGLSLSVGDPAARGGYILTSSAPACNPVLHARKKAKLRLTFSPRPLQDAAGALPVYTDFREICINGTPLPSLPATSTAQKPFRYEMEVEEGDTLRLYISQRPHRYKLGEVRNILRRRHPAPVHIEIPRRRGLFSLALYGLLRWRRFRMR